MTPPSSEPLSAHGSTYTNPGILGLDRAFVRSHLILAVIYLRDLRLGLTLANLVGEGTVFLLYLGDSGMEKKKDN